MSRYLKLNNGDPFVYSYTEVLAARGDMHECDAKGAKIEAQGLGGLTPAPEKPVVITALPPTEPPRQSKVAPSKKKE